MGRGLRDTIIYKINKLQGCILQHREYSQYFTVTINKIEPLKTGLKLSIQKTKIWSHHFIANRWGNNVNSDGCYILGLQNHCRW